MHTQHERATLARTGVHKNSSRVLGLQLHLCVHTSLQVHQERILHPELHVCLCNRSAALLALGRAESALQDAQHALAHLQDLHPG